MSNDILSVYRIVYNAKFWKDIGFRNKRAGEMVEEEEKVYMENYIKDIIPIIDEKRDHVRKYMMNFYKSKIGELNTKDEYEIYPALYQERNKKTMQDMEEKARNKVLMEAGMRSMETGSSSRGKQADISPPKLTLQSVVGSQSSDTPIDDFSDIGEVFEYELDNKSKLVAIITGIKNICSQYPEEECSKEIFSYLEQFAHEF